MNQVRDDCRDRFARRAHAVLVAALILGIATWLARTYCFKPLRLETQTPVIAP